MSVLNAPLPRPIVKWAGGKTKLLTELLPRVPDFTGRYFEPFAGGLALFFALRPASAVLSDANADLVAMYRAVASDVEQVIAGLRYHAERHSEEHYYLMRDAWNARDVAQLTDDERAPLFIYLNKTCFNGLWRVNRAGEMNVSYGRYANPRVCDPVALRAASAALHHAELRSGDYRTAVNDAARGDFVYLDPPYDGTFNAYTAAGTFDQRELARLVRELHTRGCHVLVSNSSTELIRDLYRDFKIEQVRAARFINSNGDGRGSVDELLISTFGAPTNMTRQTNFPGIEPAASEAEDPPCDQEVADSLDRWLSAKKKQAGASEATKLKHEVLIGHMVEKGIDRYPYIDEVSGKKKYVVADRTPKAKTITAPSRKQQGQTPEQRAQTAATRAENEAASVESRRVKRSEVAAEIDPFASTRSQMEPR